MQLSDPLVKTIMDALKETSAPLDDKIHALIRAGKIAEAYRNPQSYLLSALEEAIGKSEPNLSSPARLTKVAGPTLG